MPRCNCGDDQVQVVERQQEIKIQQQEIMKKEKELDSRVSKYHHVKQKKRLLMINDNNDKYLMTMTVMHM